MDKYSTNVDFMRLWNNIIQYILATVIIVCYADCLSAHPRVLTIEAAVSERYVLGQEVSALEDKSGKRTFDDVRTEQGFVSIRGTYPNFSYTSSAYWLKFQCIVKSAPIKGSWLIAAYYPSIDYCDVYVCSGAGTLLSRISAGAQVSWNNKIIPHRYHLTPLLYSSAQGSSSQGDTLTVFMRVQSRMTLAIPLEIISERAFAENERTELIPAWMYYGIALGMLLYNFFLFIVLRDRAYLFYICYVASYSSFIFVSVNALVFQYFPNYASLVPTLVTTLSLLGNIFGVLFAKEFLHLWEFGKWSVRLGWSLIAVCALGLCVQWIIPIPIMHRSLNVIALFVIAFMLTNALHTIRRGFRPARFFLAAWLLFFVGAVVFILSNLAFLPKTPFVQSSLQLGSALEMVLLSLALADRISTLRKERERAHAEALQGEIYRLRTIELAEANKEIVRQKDVLEEQARNIEIANAMLNEQNERLIVLDKEKNEFLGIAAHDLKNPLSAIKGMTEVMIMDGERMPMHDRSVFLRQILLTTERMAELVRNLLDVNAIEQGGITLSPLRVNITPMVQEALDDYEGRAHEKSLHLRIEAPDHALFVYADSKAVRQVLDNLISNAVKYSPLGKQVNVRLSEYMLDKPKSPVKEDVLGLARKIKGFVRIEIQDEGEGISKEDMKQLFGKFTRLTARPTAGEHSTGLGLSIVKKLVEAMNGKVWCESELGRGSTFIVELPM